MNSLKKVGYPWHSLHHLLPPYRISDLRNRGHIFQLPEYATDLHKKSFIIRTLGYINMFNKIAGPAMFCLCVFKDVLDVFL